MKRNALDVKKQSRYAVLLTFCARGFCLSLILFSRAAQIAIPILEIYCGLQKENCAF